MSLNFALMYKAIVFDLDGTAVANTREATPSQRLIKAVAAARGHSHLIAATGRPFSAAMPVIAALGLTDPCVILGGTVIIDPKTHTVVQQVTLTPAAVAAIFNALKPFPYQLYIRDEGIGESLSAAPHHLNAEIEIMFAEDVVEPDATHMKQVLNAIPDTLATSAPSWSGRGEIIMITHRNGTKEHAVAEVLRQLGVKKAQTIGVGDGDNDVHLFAAVGHKIAMGNAGPALKAAADEIAPHIDEDGLAQIIERYGVKK